MSDAPVSILSRNDSPIPQIPWMVGATKDEGYSMYAGIIMLKPELLEELNTDWENIAPKTFDYGKFLPKNEQGQVSEKLKRFYFGDGEISAGSLAPLINLHTDQMFLHGVYTSAIETASKTPVYLYQYAYRGPISLFGPIFKVEGLDGKSRDQFAKKMSNFYLFWL